MANMRGAFQASLNLVTKRSINDVPFFHVASSKSSLHSLSLSQRTSKLYPPRFSTLSTSSPTPFRTYAWSQNHTHNNSIVFQRSSFATTTRSKKEGGGGSLRRNKISKTRGDKKSKRQRPPRKTFASKVVRNKQHDNQPSSPHTSKHPPLSSTAASLMEHWQVPTTTSASNNIHSSSRFKNISSPAHRQHQEYMYKLKRFQDKEAAFCDTVAKYRDVWYHHEWPNDVPTTWKRAIQFQHPPLSVVSWPKVVESEGLFRDLCTLSHELVVVSTSLTADLPSGGGSVDQEVEDFPEGLHAATEDLLCALVPFWEEMRKERAMIVERCRPMKNSSEDDSSSNQADHQANTGWMGWLKSTFGGNKNQSLQNVSITAHEDLLFSPSQYHYSKLVGQLYFDFAPLAKHNESKQFVHDNPVGEFPSTQAFPREYRDILERRANKIQFIVDQCTSPNHLTDKTIRLLVRSYVDIGTLDAAHQAERVYNAYPKHQKNLLWYVLNGYLKVVDNQLQNHRLDGKRASTVEEPEKKVGMAAALATKRICELASAKHSLDPSEFQSCSLVAFQALATMAPFSESLKGYHDRLHSLGILKFGPWTWESITKTSQGEQAASISDLDLHPKDHKTLSLLVSIYGHDHEYMDRALKVLDLMFDRFPTDELRDSLSRETFHALLKCLIQQQKSRLKAESSGGKSHENPELDAAFRLVDRMMTESVWWPINDTFYLLFKLTAHSGPDAERVRTKLETCVFMTNDNEANDADASRSSTYPLYPMKAANFALNAWVETAEANGGEVVPSKPDPSERAWDIIRSLQIASTPLLLPAEAAGDIYELGSTPDVTTYLLALRICGRVKSKKSLEVALKILDAVEKEGLITKGSICTTLLKAINNSSDIEQRIKATKQVYEAALKEEPNLKKSVREAFSKNIGYFRNIHPALFEEHFGELDLSLLEPSLEVQDQYQLSRSTDFNSISSLSVSSSSDYGRRGIHTQCAPIDNPFNHSFDNNVSYQNFTTSSSQVSFVVSILGPPNAGKSTLFNRLQCKESNKSYRLGSGKGKSRRRGGKDYDSIRGRIASRHTSKGGAIVSPEAGTTRDRRECWGRIGGTEFRLMDTAGVDGDRIQTWNDNVRSSKKISKSEEQAMEQAMMEQTMKAAQQSDLVLLLWDARVGVTHDLLETARWLRKLGKHTNVVILANKLEGDAWAQDGESPVMEHLNDVLHLGLGEAIPISALHGEGMADLALIIEQLKGKKQLDQDELFTHGMPKATLPSNDSKPLQIAIIGRQNVGKSTLVNTLLEDQRVLTGPTPGLTRDAIAVEWVSEDGQGVQIVDTAGIQKLTKRKDDAIEDMSVADALRAMKTAEVAVLVLDAEAMYIQRLELALCNAVIEEGRALVVAANKMDLLEFSNDYTPQHFMEAVREQLETRIPMLRKTPIVPMSCVTGEGVSDLLPTSKDARDRWAQTFPTGVLNRWLREVIDSAPLPVVSGVRAKLKYIIQTKGRPPTFIIFANVDQLPDSYLRYLTKQFQDSFELFGMPVRLLVKRSAKSNPYERRQQKRGGFGLGGREARMQRRVSDLRQKRRRSKKDNQ